VRLHARAVHGDSHLAPMLPPCQSGNCPLAVDPCHDRGMTTWAAWSQAEDALLRVRVMNGATEKATGGQLGRTGGRSARTGRALD
jgi:hypothetical protein